MAPWWVYYSECQLRREGFWVRLWQGERSGLFEHGLEIFLAALWQEAWGVWASAQALQMGTWEQEG